MTELMQAFVLGLVTGFVAGGALAVVAIRAFVSGFRSQFEKRMRQGLADVPRKMLREAIADMGSAPPCCASTCEAIAKKIEEGGA